MYVYVYVYVQHTKGVLVHPLREPILPSVPRPVLDGTFWTTQTIWARLSPQCRQWSHASPIPSLSASVEPRPGTTPRLLQRLVDGFMRSSYKKPVITCPKSRTNSSHTQATQTLPSFSTGTHSNLTLQFLPFRKLHPARTRGAWLYLWFEDSCDALPFSAPTFCSVHIHNFVAKKRDASTHLLRRLHARMAQNDVDVIGGDFNMSAFSTVMCSLTQSFRLLATRSCGRSVPWKTQIASVMCPSARVNGMWMHTAATNSTSRILHLGLVTPRPAFLFFYIYAPPTSQALTVSCAVNKPSRNAWKPSASWRAGTAFAGKHSGCSLRVVAAPSSEPHCSDLCMLSIWTWRSRWGSWHHQRFQVSSEPPCHLIALTHTGRFVFVYVCCLGQMVEASSDTDVQ